jgi:CHRD domain
MRSSREALMKQVRTCVAVTCVGLFALVGAPAARAETIAFTAELSGANEVPPNTASASGKAEASFDSATKVLTYTVTFTGLTGPAIGAHLHGPAEAGKNAGIVVPFNFVASPIKGTATLTDAQVADLMAGRWYVNIHTAAHPGGELRGQLKK